MWINPNGFEQPFFGPCVCIMLWTGCFLFIVASFCRVFLTSSKRGFSVNPIVDSVFPWGCMLIGNKFWSMHVHSCFLFQTKYTINYERNKEENTFFSLIWTILINSLHFRCFISMIILLIYSSCLLLHTSLKKPIILISSSRGLL